MNVICGFWGSRGFGTAKQSFPDSCLHSWMAARQACLEVKRAQHLCVPRNKECYQSNSNLQFIKKCLHEVEGWNFYTPTMNLMMIDWELSSAAIEIWLVLFLYYDYLRLFPHCWQSGYPFVTENCSAMNQKHLKNLLIKLIWDNGIPAKNNKLIMKTFQTPLFSAPQLIQT